MLDMKLH